MSVPAIHSDTSKPAIRTVFEIGASSISGSAGGAMVGAAVAGVTGGIYGAIIGGLINAGISCLAPSSLSKDNASLASH
ncbi:MAG TPA: hypothetical protein VL981_00980 [Candidatus Methylacidiphilales bacterium]|nr:hypothetical protein [Candidatus Methylacidiphilales bacterium]